jgi:hypothetical protein
MDMDINIEIGSFVTVIINDTVRLRFDYPDDLMRLINSL